MDEHEEVKSEERRAKREERREDGGKSMTGVRGRRIEPIEEQRKAAKWG